MSSSKRLAVSLPALLLSGLAAAQTLTCPEKIEAASTLAAAPSGWTTSIDPRPNPYSRMSVTSGPPDEEAFLVPDTNTKTRMTWVVPAGQQYWAVCHYLNSSVRLVQQVPPGVRQCTLDLKPVGTRATQQDTRLVCK